MRFKLELERRDLVMQRVEGRIHLRRRSRRVPSLDIVRMVLLLLLLVRVGELLSVHGCEVVVRRVERVVRVMSGSDDGGERRVECNVWWLLLLACPLLLLACPLLLLLLLLLLLFRLHRQLRVGRQVTRWRERARSEHVSRGDQSTAGEAQYGPRRLTIERVTSRVGLPKSDALPIECMLVRTTARRITATLQTMPLKRTLPFSSQSPATSPSKKPRPSPTRTNRQRSPSPAGLSRDKAGHGEWKDWPAPQEQMETAREWIREW